jgi:hypothetical protein
MMFAAPFVVVPVVGCQTREQIMSCFASLELDVANVTTA